MCAWQRVESSRMQDAPGLFLTPEKQQQDLGFRSRTATKLHPPEGQAMAPLLTDEIN